MKELEELKNLIDSLNNMGKPKYTCESIINEEEYINLQKNFLGTYSYYVFIGTFINIIIYPIILIATRRLLYTGIFFIVFEIVSMIYYKIRFKSLVKKKYNNLVNKRKIDTKFTNEFYENYMINKSDFVTTKIGYMQIDKCLETINNIYIKNSNRNYVVVLQKDKCSKELLEFLKSKIKNKKEFFNEKDLPIEKSNEPIIKPRNKKKKNKEN